MGIKKNQRMPQNAAIRHLPGEATPAGLKSAPVGMDAIQN
jgi:hypothetical protein